MNFLKNHPFAVEAFFERSVVLTFAVHKEEIESLIPDKLRLDCFQDKWAFIAVAMVQTSAMRPKGFPLFMGNNFFLIGTAFLYVTLIKLGRICVDYIISRRPIKRKWNY